MSARAVQGIPLTSLDQRSSSCMQPSIFIFGSNFIQAFAHFTCRLSQAVIFVSCMYDGLSAQHFIGVGIAVLLPGFNISFVPSI